MRAMILLVLLLALIALFSFHEPLRPYWESRFPAVAQCLNEGRYRDAWAAATAADPPGTPSPYWQKSEPLGEPAPPGEASDRAEEPAAPDSLDDQSTPPGSE
jgi:hypothetical protein